MESSQWIDIELEWAFHFRLIMNTFEDLRTAVKQTLEQNGSLAATRAKLRADIFATLQDPTEVKPRIPHENLLINELIIEYLKHNNLHCTAYVSQIRSLPCFSNVVLSFHLHRSVMSVGMCLTMKFCLFVYHENTSRIGTANITFGKRVRHGTTKCAWRR